MTYLIASVRDAESLAPHIIVASLYNPATNVRYNLELNLGSDNKLVHRLKLSTGPRLEWRGLEALAVWHGIAAPGGAVAHGNYEKYLINVAYWVSSVATLFKNYALKTISPDGKQATGKLADELKRKMPFPPVLKISG